MPDKFRVSVLLDRYGVLLSEKQRFIMDCYYNEDLSLSEIAENEGITRQGVRDLIKRCETALIDYEDKLGISSGISRLKEYASAVKEETVMSDTAVENLVKIIEEL